MKLHEFLAKNDFDGELIVNGVNFDMTCSLCFNQTVVGKKAFDKYPNIMNAVFVGMEQGRYVIFENKEVADQDVIYTEGKKFLEAISGYISEELYNEMFPCPLEL